MIAHPPRVLIVNASADEREMYAASFRRDGFTTVQASTATDGYRLASELPPAAVVTDIRLAGDEDGLCFTRRLKEDSRTRDVPVVILTAFVATQDGEPATSSGCDLWLLKPCLPDVLSRTVVNLIERRHP